MNAVLLRYEASDRWLRLLFAMAAAVVLNALYCLAYTYSQGHPATLWEAFSWGIINIAPWIAAIELGRQMTRFLPIAMVVALAGAASLALGAAESGGWPSVFELVRRLPGMVITIAILSGIDLYRRRKAGQQSAEVGAMANALSCDWARAAGNYVELHSRGHRPRLVRSTLASLVEEASAPLLRIHRSFAVAPEIVERVERGHVWLSDGTRLPIGNAYRARLNPI